MCRGFTTSPTPSPTHPLSVPYTSPTSPTNVPRFQTFHLKEMQWRRQGNHAIDKFMANVAATIGEQQPGMMLGSSTGAPPIPNPSVMADLARAGEWRQQGLLSEAELQAAKHASKRNACMFHFPFRVIVLGARQKTAVHHHRIRIRPERKKRPLRFRHAGPPHPQAMQSWLPAELTWGQVSRCEKIVPFLFEKAMPENPTLQGRGRMVTAMR